ncbi:MAG: PilZ domain-containing protein [Alphaproteobacteria bacterium]|nr:PilZ domain-containing protein [Alphaproteobacteria bacterium]
MSSKSNQQVVHESETQRQFIRLPVPARATVDGGVYEVKDLSSGGVSIRGISGLQVGSIIPLSLHLPFVSFSMDINLDAEVRYFLPDQKVAGLSFSNLSQEQVALINHVVKSFQAGEIVSSSAVLNVAARDNFTKPRNKGGAAAASFDAKRSFPGLLLVLVLGLGAAGFIVGNLYENIFTLKASSAMVQSTVVPLRAVGDGIFKSKITAEMGAVSAGQVLGSVDGDDVKSPCDCDVEDIAVMDGEYVLPGQVIASLVPVGDKPWVVAQVKTEDAVRLGEKAQAQISIAGTSLEISGRVVGMKAAMGDVGSAAQDGEPAVSSNAVQVRIAPDQNIPLDLAGRPARVVFVINPKK